MVNLLHTLLLILLANSGKSVDTYFVNFLNYQIIEYKSIRTLMRIDLKF